MGKEGKTTSKDIMGQVYREFSRQKYQKYKHQFPQLRESELVGRIIKEWDSLDNIAKEQLKTHYETKKYLTPEDISSSESEMRERLAQKAKQRKDKKLSAVLEPTTTYFSKSSSRPKKARSDSGARGSEQKDDSKRMESSSPLVAKRKIINKTKLDYVTFYKQMTQYLNREHPRWTQSQVTSIVQLEWRKKKSSAKKFAKKALRKTRKVSSGYQFYRRFRRFSATDAKNMWRHFPKETKRVWDYKANDVEPEPAYLKKSTVVLTADHDTSEELNFLHNPIY